MPGAAWASPGLGLSRSGGGRGAWAPRAGWPPGGGPAAWRRAASRRRIEKRPPVVCHGGRRPGGPLAFPAAGRGAQAVGFTDPRSPTPSMLGRPRLRLWSAFMSLFELKGRVALVTGGNGGIGLGMARGLAEAGAAVAVAGRNAAKSE